MSFNEVQLPSVKALIKNLVKTSAWLCICWWRNTEPNPRPISEQKSVRKDAVPVLNHLAVLADTGRNRWTVRLKEFDAATGIETKHTMFIDVHNQTVNAFWIPVP